MKEEFLNIPLIKNEEKNRFEIQVEGHFAFIDYKVHGNDIALVHTEVPEVLGGRGVAAALVEKTLNFIKDNEKLVLPFCPYVFSFIKKNPQWKSLVNPKFKGFDQL